MAESIEVSIWRGGAEGRYQAFTVPRAESQTVLDVVTWVQRHADPTLSYRFACRVGMCGSCAMTVNGRPRWTCRTHVSKAIEGGRMEIGPLANLPVIKDLATDMTRFFERWRDAKGAFVPSRSRHQPLEAISPATRQRIEADAAIECINCGVCWAACDTVRWSPDYLGPAALNRAWSLVNDVRDAGNGERLHAVSQRGGCHNCHSHQSCEQLCPKGLNPTASIAGLKRRSMQAYLRGETRVNVRLYVFQRITALLMVPLIAAHLATMIHAIQGGLTGKEILARTQGSLGWALFYALFVVLAAIHGAIGVRGVAAEWTSLDQRSLDGLMWGFGLLLAILGLRAVAAVVLP